jgi:hypothetical protein
MTFLGFSKTVTANPKKAHTPKKKKRKEGEEEGKGERLSHNYYNGYFTKYCCKEEI